MNLEILKNKICSNKYKVISFDIFDTLIVRPCMLPTDILKLVGLRCGFDGNFLEMRRVAEKQARRVSKSDEITYDDIYAQLGEIFDIDEELLLKLKNTELEIEKQYLYARQAMKGIFDFAKSIGKKIILVSDMYLPKDVLEDILSNCGYTGYDKLYLSSEYKVMKSSGKLYDIVLNDLKKDGINANNILHMGDNLRSDVTIPQTKQISTVHIPGTMWLLRKNKKLKLLFENVDRNLDNSFLIGFSANLVFNDPFRPYDMNSYFYGSKYSLANMLLAPMFYSFNKWMLEDSIKQNINTLCMVYRDGYIPEKIIECMSPYYKDVPEIRRLYLTRNMINRFHCFDKNPVFESINEMLFSDRMTVDEFIRERLYVSDSGQYEEVLDVFKKHNYKDGDQKVGRRDDLSVWIKELNSVFIKNASESTETIKEYCESVLNGCGRLAVYDIGYRGRVSDFLKKYLDIESIGYHFFAKENVRTCDNADNMKYGIMYGLLTEKTSMLLNLLTEDLLNERTASVKDVKKDDNGDFKLIRDGFNSDNSGITLLQDYIVQYSKKFSDLFREDLKSISFDLINYFELYVQFLEKPMSIDVKVFRDLSIDDSSFMNPRAKDVYREWNLKHIFRSSSDRVLYEMKLSIFNGCDEIKYRLKQTIMFVGNPKYINSKVIKDINNISQRDEERYYHLLMETSEHSKGEYKKYSFGTDIISKIDMPRGYDEKVSVELSKEMKDIIDSKEYLKDTVSKVYSQMNNIGEGYAEALVCYWYRYFCKVINLYNQKNAELVFVVWNEKSIMHTLLKNICDEQKISIRFVNEADISLDNEIKKIDKQVLTHIDKNKKMRIAICASMPRKGYSGGRTHALNLAECLSYKNNEVFFISRYLPMFKDEMKENPGHNDIHFVCSDDLINEEAYNIYFGEQSLDYLIVVPHRDKNEAFYLTARNLAKRMNAKLVLLNYETPNWKEKYLGKDSQDIESFEQWLRVTDDGCLILCSDKESIKFAKDFYIDNPLNTTFDYWYPVINSLVADKVDVQKENRIVAFVRPGDINKGSNDILKLLEWGVEGYEVVLICGRGVKDAVYYNFMKQLKKIKKDYSIKCTVKIQPTDYEKFVEVSKARYMLFPSYFEGYGTPPIEAQYCNTVCLVYDLPVLRETCKEGAVYCEYGNIKDMHDKLIDLIKSEYKREDLHDEIKDIAEFHSCADRLDEMFRSHLDDEWRCN